ncbi:hypothetical protein SUGI_0896170 [Cryptomeria japonica]|uniref:protein GLUTAMINE DUMPER 5 n=1 Tax=Cryptomeria japonica TaxID=3369 RepID=UPI002414AA27|nr:protein GLUTAMINE DUMPER 5 [Cryptomeria japonica]GLJ43166.1 hypothetical protein SUGI_0896170 [Cryptomeria japonica]
MVVVMVLQAEAEFTSSSAPNNASLEEWKSPVPYLLGGIGAMIGLIALALLILACSYFKSPGHGQGGANQVLCRDEIHASGDYGEEKVMVIMAGEEKPTFLAKPVMVEVPT